MTRATWAFTDDKLISISWAICRLVLPEASQRNASSSRAVSSTECASPSEPRGSEETSASVATTGEKLIRLRRGQGLTQAELSEASGVAQSTIAQIETGKRPRPKPHPGTLKKLAGAMGTDAAALLED
jgi:DNA-binding XRE family transcriptional regulator